MSTESVAGRSLRALGRRDTRLVPIAVAAWVAAGWATLLPQTTVVLAVVLWTLGAALLAVASRAGRRWRGRLALTAVIVAVAAAVATHVAAAEPARAALAQADIAGGRALTLDVTAVGKIEPSATGWRFEAVATRLQRGADVTGAESFPGGVPILVRLGERPEGLDLGASLRMSGTAWATAPGERAVLVVDAAGVPVVIAPASGVLGAAAALRRGLLDLTATLPQPGGGLVAGLAVGDTSAVTADLDAAMKTSSLSHLTAVSGANCALVVAGAFGAAALCRARRGIRVAAGLVALAGFVVLVSPEPSVVRAAVMAAIAMLGILIGRPGAGLSLLAAAVGVSLIADPWLAGSLGFALSVAATAALLVGAGPLADGLGRWMPRPLALGIAVPLAAQLACGPLIVLIAPRLSVYGVVANILAGPAAPAGTILGLAACLLAGIPAVGSGLAALAWLPASWIAGTATTFASLPGSVVDWPAGGWGLASLAIVGAAVAALIVRAPARVRAVGVAVLAVAASVGFAYGPVATVLERSRLPTGWAIAACDVGQGDAVVVRSEGVVALIDTGPDPAPLAACLDLLGIPRIDLLVLTHFDLDHRGGVRAVEGRVGVVLHGPTDGPDAEAALARLGDHGAHLVGAARGMTGELGAARWRVLWPRGDVPPGNDASVVVEIRGGGVPDSIYLGDLSAEGQRAMRAGTTLLSSYAVVKVAHHGSADQDANLYLRLHAAVALVTVGENDYGHPRQETLDLLVGAGARVMRTDRDGLVAVWAEGGGLRVWRERAPTAVAPAG